jgi:3-oxoadipate enol-lactonase
VPRSHAFESWDDLAALDLPVTVVASLDEADPEHPYAVGQRYVEAIPGARLLSEEPGKSPLAWQGGQLSKVIADTAAML